MKIAAASARLHEVALTVPYRIASGNFDSATMVLVSLRDETGREGYGAATPVPYLSGDDAAGALAALDDAILPALQGSGFADLDEAVGRAASACPVTREGRGARGALAAADIALHDLRARRLGVPLSRMLGGARRALVTSITVGIGEASAMAEAAARHASRGFRIIKVKIGEEPGKDLARLAAVRRAVGPDVVLRVDANEGYSAADAVEMARAMEALGVELFEQPVPAIDLAGLREVTRLSRIPVVADESVKVAADLIPLVAEKAGSGANIKLMKCGGIREALRIDRALVDAGWRALVGCMDESRASIAAAAHFAASAASVRWIDLDGHFDLASDPFSGGVELRDGALVLSDEPGLGVAPV